VIVEMNPTATMTRHRKRVETGKYIWTVNKTGLFTLKLNEMSRFFGKYNTAKFVKEMIMVWGRCCEG
jgi:hypothetical protein